MALANFFDKTAIAASAILADFDRNTFKQRLEAHCVGLAFDAAAAVSPEGRSILDLTTRLLARLWPSMSFLSLDEPDRSLVDELKALALSINPDIDLQDSPSSVTVGLVVGSSHASWEAPSYYLGSDGWIAVFSPSEPVDCGDSANPFGAGAAACFGAANVFRHVFADVLPGGVDETFHLSLLDMSRGSSGSNPALLPIQLRETALVGLGAIGNGTIWALSRLRGLTGTLHLVDGERVALSNLQRYVLAAQVHAPVNQGVRAAGALPDGAWKVDLAAELLGRTSLEVVPHRTDWAGFLKKRGDWSVPVVAVGVDSGRDRISIQASLPERIFNAYTQPEDLGVTRHPNFLTDPCLACFYIPRSPARSDAEIIAEELGLTEYEQETKEIRARLYRRSPLDRAFLQMVADAKDVPLDELLPFEGQPIQVLRSQAVCGGLFLRLNPSDSAGDAGRAEAPMAFQSALAGLLLAVEMLADAGSLRAASIPVTTRIDLRRPLASHLLIPRQQDSSGRCLCHDSDYREAYRVKYYGNKSDSSDAIPLGTPPAALRTGPG